MPISAETAVGHDKEHLEHIEHIEHLEPVDHPAAPADPVREPGTKKKTPAFSGNHEHKEPLECFPGKAAPRKKPSPMQTLILQEDEATNGLKLCDVSPRILSESEIITRLSRMTDGEYLVIKGRVSVGVKVRETRDKVTFSDKPPTLTRQKS